MTVYTVHMQGDDAEAASFVPEGFAWIAFVVPPLWLLWHRLWLAFALWCAAAVLVSALPQISFITKELFLFCIALFCGLEGQQWRRLKLARAGKPLADIVSGETRDDAEIHFFHRWADRVPSLSLGPPIPASFAAANDAALQPAFGIFPEAEKRL